MNVVVTGASAGIGRATALAFARRGASVALIARRAQHLASVAEACVAVGGRGLVLPADLGDPHAPEDVAARVRETLGVPDVLVNNAGMPAGGRLLELDAERIERVLRVNALSAMRLTRALLPVMLDRPKAAVVFVASIAGRVGVPGSEVYAASKFALAGFADALALEVTARGAAVILVNPGPVHTEAFPHERLRSRWLVREPDDVAERIVHAVARGRSVELIMPRLFRAAPVLGAIARPVYRRLLGMYARR